MKNVRVAMVWTPPGEEVRRRSVAALLLGEAETLRWLMHHERGRVLLAPYKLALWDVVTGACLGGDAASLRFFNCDAWMEPPLAAAMLTAPDAVLSECVSTADRAISPAWNCDSLKSGTCFPNFIANCNLC